MPIQIRNPETEALVQERLRSGDFTDPEDVILHALRASASAPDEGDVARAEAIERLKSF